jgi:hypothetical protein
MLISHYIALIYDYWHLPQGQEKPKFSEITVNFNKLNSLIKQHLSWHQFYQSHLNDHSVVVIYEIMVDHLIQSSVGYLPLYANKTNIISNWHDTINYLDDNIPAELRQAHNDFTSYASRPSQGIYRSAAGLG